MKFHGNSRGLFTHEALGEAAAAALGARFPDEGLKVAKRWLSKARRLCLRFEDSFGRFSSRFFIVF